MSARHGRDTSRGGCGESVLSLVNSSWRRNVLVTSNRSQRTADKKTNKQIDHFYSCVLWAYVREPWLWSSKSLRSHFMRSSHKVHSRGSLGWRSGRSSPLGHGDMRSGRFGGQFSGNSVLCGPREWTHWQGIGKYLKTKEGGREVREGGREISEGGK